MQIITLLHDEGVINKKAILEKEEKAFLIALQTDGWTDEETDGRTYTFLKSPRQPNAKGI